MSPEQEQKWQLAGWLFFLACSLVFIVDSVQNAATLPVIANLLFLVACILFIVPLVQNLRSDD